MLRALHLILALCVAFQAAAASSTVRVCRYTGKVLAPCACPPEHRAQPGSPSLSKQACCELHKAEAPAVPAVMKATAPTPDTQGGGEWLVPAPPLLRLNWQRPGFTAVRSQAPPSTPLYLAIRSLLI